MAFNIFIIVLIGVIAYFHFVQGFFSSTISAIVAILSALLAVSYTEPVVNLLLKGKMADIAHPMILCVLFAASYIILRVIFDVAVPGNVRTPATLDKVGGALMGIVAGIFATGIFAIAVQMLPFGPTISLMGYTRYDTASDRSVSVPQGGNKQQLDSVIHDELNAKSFNDDGTGQKPVQTKLWTQADDIVLNTVYHLSDGGSLAGSRTLASVHPDWLQELFGERLGQQDGARRSALYYQGQDSVAIQDVFTATKLAEHDGQVSLLRKSKVPPELKPNPDQCILVVRVMVHSNVTDDTDKIFRFSTGSIRLVYKSTDYYPVGMLERAQTVLLNKPDDYLFLNLSGGDAMFDAVFLVDRSILEGDQRSHAISIAPDAFLSVKRLAMLDLSNHEVKETINDDAGVAVMRTAALVDELKLPPPPQPGQKPADTAAAAPAAPTPTPTPASPAPTPEAPPTAKPTISASARVGTDVGFPIGVNTNNNDDPSVTIPGGTLALRGGNIASIQLNADETLKKIAAGDSTIKDFAVPDGFKLVQISYTISDPSQGFAWASQLGSIKAVDSNGNDLAAAGVIVRLNAGGEDKAMVRYNMESHLSAVPAMSGVVESTTFLFVVRSGSHVASLQVAGDTTPAAVDVP